MLDAGNNCLTHFRWEENSQNGVEDLNRETGDYDTSLKALWDILHPVMAKCRNNCIKHHVTWIVHAHVYHAAITIKIKRGACFHAHLHKKILKHEHTLLKILHADLKLCCVKSLESVRFA